MWVSDWLAAVDDRFMYGVLFLKEFQQNVVCKTAFTDTVNVK